MAENTGCGGSQGHERRGRSSRRRKGDKGEGDQRRLEDGVQFMIKQGGLQGVGLREGMEQGWRLLRDSLGL